MIKKREKKEEEKKTAKPIHLSCGRGRTSDDGADVAQFVNVDLKG